MPRLSAFARESDSIVVFREVVIILHFLAWRKRD